MRHLLLFIIFTINSFKIKCKSDAKIMQQIECQSGNYKYLIFIAGPGLIWMIGGIH